MIRCITNAQITLPPSLNNYRYRLPRTQASLCKKQWCAYDKFTWSIVVRRDGRRGWWEECTWNARRLAVSKYDFLQVVICISLSFTIFCYLFLLYWPMLIFFCHLGVNSCCYSWYIWHRPMPYLKSWNINMSTTEALQELDLHSRNYRFVSYNYIKVYINYELNCNVVINISNFTVVNFYLLGLLFTVVRHWTEN
jgi:hypothetical protein